MENKKVIDKLQDYFFSKDPKLVARICGNFAIDLNRFLNFEHLSQKEQDHLILRTKNNMKQIKDFIESGSADDLKIRHVIFTHNEG